MAVFRGEFWSLSFCNSEKNAPEIAQDLFGKLENLRSSEILRQENFAGNPLNALGIQQNTSENFSLALLKTLGFNSWVPDQAYWSGA